MAGAGDRWLSRATVQVTGLSATCELAYLGSLRAARMTVLSAALRRRRLRICREIRAARARSEKIEFTERAQCGHLTVSVG